MDDWISDGGGYGGVSVVGCSSENTTGGGSNQYPTEVQNTYTESCIRGGGNASYCACTLDEFQKNHTYEEFKVIDTKLMGEVPDEIIEVVAACR